MLTTLNIKNFAIIDSLELDFANNMTVLTGETGAGKSIIVDTLMLVLGGRADSNALKKDAKCDINATFDLSNLSHACAWLAEHELIDTEADECLVRRVINTDGRSKSYINGLPVPQQLTRELAGFLIEIHGQHEHYSLMKPQKQREILDLFAGHNELCKQVRESYELWQEIDKQLNNLHHLTEDGEQRLPLLKYQLEELDKLELDEDELEELHNEHKELSAAETILQTCNHTINNLNGDDDKAVLTNLYNTQKQLNKIAELNTKFATAAKLLDEAGIALDSATQEIKSYLTNANLNPERLNFLDERLNTIYDLARKHKVKPEDLFNTWQQLHSEVTTLEEAQDKISDLENMLEVAKQNYLNLAKKLSQSRQKAAQKFSTLITEKMHELAMRNGKFSINVKTDDNQLTANGIDQIQFNVTTNPGHPPAPLNKIASGGELSRISLAIQVIIAAKTQQPTLIFDEVDVGIGGKTAAIVGKMLSEIGQNSQILCVTHLPQVAAYGEQHFNVVKSSNTDSVSVDVNLLDRTERITEIARMLGGIDITQKSLEHAEELLSEDCGLWSED